MLAFDPLYPLNRCEGETRASHCALLDYWNMGSGRSLRKLLAKYREQSVLDPFSCLPPTTRYPTLSFWSTKNLWQARVDTANRIQQAEDVRLKTEAMKAEAESWEQRRLEVREKDWQQSEALRELTDRLLAEGPRFLKTTRKFVPGRDGMPDREVVTVGLDVKLMITGLQTASKLQRLAAEMETEHTLAENTTPEDIEEIRKKRWESMGNSIREFFSATYVALNDQ